MTPSTILFSGGGSLGHVVPSIAVATAIQSRQPETRCVFVCAERQEETDVIHAAGYRYHTLRSPKFPQTLSLKILTFPFGFLRALRRARRILHDENPSLIFSKGGFTSVPLVLAAWIRHIPIVLHESDSTLSFSSHCIAQLAKKVCTGFPDISVPQHIRVKTVQTGNPIRADILRGSEAAGERITGFSGRRPIVMIIGGSQGSVALNMAVQESLQALVNIADIIHLTGKGKSVATDHARYFVRESVREELPHLYAVADIIVSRAGAGVLCELAALQKPVIVVPLIGVARDHQWKNAVTLESRGAVLVLRQEDLANLSQMLQKLLTDPARQKALGEALEGLFPRHAAERVADVILAVLRSPRV